LFLAQEMEKGNIPVKNHGSQGLGPGKQKLIRVGGGGAKGQAKNFAHGLLHSTSKWGRDVGGKAPGGRYSKGVLPKTDLRNFEEF